MRVLQANAALDAANAHKRVRTEREIARDDFIAAHANNFAIRPTRTSGRFRFRSMPILSRSRA